MRIPSEGLDRLTDFLYFRLETCIWRNFSIHSIVRDLHKGLCVFLDCLTSFEKLEPRVGSYSQALSYCLSREVHVKREQPESEFLNPTGFLVMPEMLQSNSECPGLFDQRDHDSLGFYLMKRMVSVVLNSLPPCALAWRRCLLYLCACERV